MKVPNKDIDCEKRDDRRIEYSGHIFFSTKNGFYEGDLTNYSEYGLFIKTTKILPVGSVITIALPYLNGHVKRQGQVVRVGRNGFGIEFFRENCGPFEKVTPREMKIMVK
jgi:hypothetical protein